MLKRILSIVILLGVAAVAVLYWLGTRDGGGAAQTSEMAVQDMGRVERGRYLALAANCVGCHTVAGSQAYAGGTPLPTPFGTLYGPNITSDRQYGIGAWSADEFWHALHNGKGRNGELLYPGFPYTSFTHIPREDADALYAYFQTVPAAAAPNRPHELDFPYNHRILMSMWRALFFRPADVSSPQTRQAQDSPDVTPQWLRGRYLVEGVGHCAACHAPRDILGASDLSQGMSGGLIPGQDWYAPPLSNDAVAGVGKWSAEEIATLLKTGVSARSAVSGPMAEVVSHSTQHLSDPDALAIGVYLKSLPDTPPSLRARAEPPGEATLARGRKIYEDSCVQCHKADGAGVAPDWPPLAGNVSVVAPTPVNAIRMVLDGGFAPATASNPRPHGMPPFAQRLNDNDIAAVVSYVRNSWGNQGGVVTSLDVKNARNASAAE
jgi:mono/diheme cytochrome c family protein